MGLLLMVVLGVSAVLVAYLNAALVYAQEEAEFWLARCTETSIRLDFFIGEVARLQAEADRRNTSHLHLVSRIDPQH